MFVTRAGSPRKMPTTSDTTRPAAPAAPPDDGTWLASLKSVVQPVTFKKGREVAEGRRVALLTREGLKVTAKVQGSEAGRYDVALWPATGGGVESTCSCASWNKYGPHCKHVVAAALVYLARVRASAVRPAPAEGPTEAAEESAGPAPSSPTPAEVVGLPALAKLENWLGLSSLPDQEFLYRLTPVAQAGGRHWVVDVRRADQAAKGPVSVKRLLSAQTRIAAPDERIFNALAHLEARYDGRLVLSDEDLALVMELFEHRKVVYRGTHLVFSREPTRPVVKLESRPDGAVARVELAGADGSVLGLKDVILLPGKKTWVIAGQRATPVEPDFPSRLWRKWLLEPAMVFPTSQMDRVMSFFAAHLPRHRLSLQADGLDVDESLAPSFVLTLEGTPDRVKAKLAARYGERVTVPVSPTAQHLGYAAGGGATGKSLFLRREAEERAAGKALVDLGFRFDPSAQTYEAAGDAALDFWSGKQKELPKEWESFAAAPPKIRMRSRVKPKIRVNMSATNWFELDADFKADDQSVDLGAVRLWLESGRRYIALKDGSFAPADKDELQKAATLLEEAGALPGAKNTRLPLFHATALEQLANVDGVEFDTKARKAMGELRELEAIPTAKPPESLNATLRHYQEAGLSWLWFLHRHGLSSVLADDMGLGKTIQALALLLKAKEEEGPVPSLVVAPTSVLANWEREIEKFTPKLSSLVWHGVDRKESVGKLAGVDVVLTSYALLRRDLAELKNVKFRCVVLDEAQNIKNADSATAQASKSLTAETRLALTGTPLENRLGELWSLFDFLMPGFLGSSDDFHDRFEHPIAVQGDAQVRGRLRSRIKPFIMRRLKSEVAKDLPPKTETIAWCEMDPAQAALYKEVLTESRRKVEETIKKAGFNRSRISILAALMRLRQVCCDPRLLKLPPGTALPPSAKLERFMGLVEDLVEEGHRALVFSQFTEMLELLKEQADARGLKYMYLDGRTKDRMKKVDAFNAPDGPPLFFISLKAGGTGLNLTAADYVIHYDPWWNPAVEDQATDRTHRIGQTKAVFSYKLITRGTVEEKIVSLQQRKRDLAAGILGSDEEVAKSLTEKDIEELFKVE
jgi:superfamily II DNA or RNA helicase